MLKVKDVATRLNVSTRTVQVWVNSGKLPAFKAGSVIRIEPEALDAFITASCPTAKKDQQAVESATPTPQVDALARLLGPPTTRRGGRKGKPPVKKPASSQTRF